MKLKNQHNSVKAELIKLYYMLSIKEGEMEKLNAPRPDIRWVIGQKNQSQD